MRTFAIVLLVAIVAFAADPAKPAPAGGPAPEAPKIDITEVTFADSKELLQKIQGINESTVWIVQFHDNDPEKDVATKLADCFKEESLKDKSYTSLKYQVAQIDVNNNKFDQAMEALAMKSNTFQGTYPVALVMRKRKGLFAWGFDLTQAVCERLPEVADGKIDPYA